MRIYLHSTLLESGAFLNDYSVIPSVNMTTFHQLFLPYNISENIYNPVKNIWNMQINQNWTHQKTLISAFA